ncbi:type II toxin-antitoxin system PemK/MazF family toxin [Mycobacterium colombiense]
MRVNRGEVWLARVPYNENPQEAKQRRVVVLGWSPIGPLEDSVILVAPVTSFGEGGQPRNGDIAILNWRRLGFLKPSWVRARRIWGANPAAFDRTKGSLGSVTDTELTQILTEVANLFK